MDRRFFVTGAVALVGGVGLGAGQFSGPAMAAEPAIYANSSTSVAINGADPVAYFTQSDLVYGQEAIFAEWEGAKWLFSSAENRDMFVANPEKYAPQYGGYCAFAMANNYVAPTVPEAWTVRNGKLYLNFSLSVRKRWLKDPDGFIARADKNWPGALG